MSECAGEVVDRRDVGLNTLLDLFWSIIDAIGFLYASHPAAYTVTACSIPEAKAVP